MWLNPRGTPALEAGKAPQDQRADLAEALDQWVLRGTEPGGVAVAHGEVDLPTVAPECGGVRRHPARKQPGGQYASVSGPRQPNPLPALRPEPFQAWTAVQWL